MARQLIKVSSMATALFASAGLYLYRRQLDLNNLSVIRFGRAAVTVSCCILADQIITIMKFYWYKPMDYFSICFCVQYWLYQSFVIVKTWFKFYSFYFIIIISLTEYCGLILCFFAALSGDSCRRLLLRAVQLFDHRSTCHSVSANHVYTNASTPNHIWRCTMSPVMIIM